MNTFKQAVQTQIVQTENGMKAHRGSGSACVDFFYKVGAMRGKDPLPAFISAYAENKDLALRILQWVRDIRGGAGERQIFRTILTYLGNKHPEDAKRVMQKVPEIGRFDDLFVFESKEMREAAYTILGDHLRSGNKLAGKWTPRKGKIAEEIRCFFGLSYKDYRKKLVALTSVVETQMCANKWDDINFSHVPSKAASNYKNAFQRHTPKYKEWVSALAKGDPSVKVNANAIFPHDVIKGWSVADSVEASFIDEQWKALPNYMGESSVLAMVDVSGSMTCPLGGSGSTSCLDVALALGLYTADKNKGAFKDTFLTFSGNPELMHINGANITDKLLQISQAAWGGNTDVIKAFKKILQTAIDGGVSDAEMPKTLLILSDMQFDACASFNDSAMQSVTRQYEASGYTVPNIVFWNLNAHSNVPVKVSDSGVAMISGFSPSIMTSILGSPDSFTPESIMLETVMKTRYDLT